VAWPLVRAGKWKEAAEAYGVRFSDLQDSLWSAWNSVKEKPQSEQDRYRFALLDFYFRTMNFSQVGWSQQAKNIAYYGRFYQEIVARLSEKQRDAIDFSHLDLWESISKQRPEARTAEDREKVVAAMKSNPGSFPAIAAMMLLLQKPPSREQLIPWNEAEQLATSPLAKLALARAAAVGIGVPLVVKRRTVEAAWQSVPSTEEKAMLLYRLATAEVAVGIPRAVEVARRIYKQFPNTLFAAEARQLAVAALAKDGRPEEAIALVRELQKDPKQRNGLDRALFAVSTAYFKSKEYDKSETILREVVRDYPDTSTVSRAMLGLSEVFAARNDPDGQRQWLLKCARLEKTEATGRGIMDTDNTRSTAIQRLAAGYERDGQWAEALYWWQAWGPRSWCGTCEGLSRAARHHHIAICQLHLGRRKEAIRECFDAIEDGSVGWSASCAVLLFEIYRQVNQVDDLVAMVAPVEEKEKQKLLKHDYYRKMPPAELRRNLPTWPIYRLKEIAELGRRKDIEGLIAVCRDSKEGSGALLGSPRRDWPCCAAAEALARCDGVVDSIRKSIQANEQAYDCSWLLYALGKNTSPRALPTLRELAKAETRCHYKHLMYAISMKGEKGEALLRDIAAGKDAYKARAARKRLEAVAAQGKSKTPWPTSPQGSLPKAIPPKQSIR